MNVLIISIFYYFCGNQISYIFCCLLLNLILFFNGYDFVILVLCLSLTINLYLLSWRSTSPEFVFLSFIQNQPIGIGLRLWWLMPLSTIFQLHRGGMHILSHTFASSTSRHEQDSNSQLKWWDTDCTCSCKSNNHTITITTYTLKQWKSTKL